MFYQSLEKKLFSGLSKEQQESWNNSPKIARFGIKAIAFTAGFMTFVAAPIVALTPRTPAPVVVEAPAPVVVEPAPVVVVEEPTLPQGDYTHINYWADEAPTTNSGDNATYDKETNTLTWDLVAFGTTDENVCVDGDMDGLQCNITYDNSGFPTKVVVIDPYDNYHISTTTFQF